MRRISVRRRLALVLASLVLLAVPACGDDSSPAADGGPSGKLLWYTSAPSFAADEIMSEFMDAYPNVEGEVLRLSTFDQWERFRSEYEAGRHLADVINLSDFGLIQEGVKAGYFHKGLPKSVTDAVAGGTLPEEYADTEGHWFSLRLTTIAPAYNTARVDEAKAKELKTWMDLCDDPYWQGLAIGTLDPREASSGYVVFWQMDQAGIAEDFFRCLGNNPKTVIYDTGGPLMNALMSGEIDVAINVDYQALAATSAGAPLAVYFPSEGVGGNPDYLVRAEKAPNPAAGDAFMDWMGSQEGMETMAKFLTTWSVRTDVNPYPDGLRPPINDVKIIGGELSLEAATADFEAFNSKWDEWLGR